jgi:ubiquinone/menaquinone biosynthesis C-methylase UbiE
VEPEEYERMHRLERNHWWFRGKREAIAALLDRTGIGPPTSGERIVDVGCGTGAVLERFGAGATAVGIDDHVEALRYAGRRPGARLMRSDARRLPFRDASVDRLFLLDVAEHVDDDRRVFAEVRRVLKPAGVAVVHVPAHPSMWSPHDEAMHHVRRYTRPELAAKLEEAGLATLAFTYTFAAILAPAACVRAVKRRNGGAERADFGVAPRWANAPLSIWQRVEAAWLRRLDLPFGLSIAAVVRPDRESSPARRPPSGTPR